MAIQQVESSQMTTTTGFDRKINEGAKNLIFDTVQKFQYSHPFGALAQELTANASDSIEEKKRAYKILVTKEKKVEDYYIERDGELYEDSKFEAGYYDFAHIDMSKNDVQLHYVEDYTKKGIGFCDLFTVTDYGVGIGQKRLEGYFQIGFSSKRNNNDSLGSFGYGAKVALATGADYYTMETVYNGQKFRFNCYSYKIQSLVPRFDLAKQKENPSITLSDGTVIYFEETTEKNHTSISTPVKKANRSKIVNAVKEKLLYFRDVKFQYTRESGSVDDIQFRANKLHESENLIISDNRIYSKPQIIIVKDGTKATHTDAVCYGYINFAEMDMPEMWGGVAIKCAIRSVVDEVIDGVKTGKQHVIQDGVSVTPSREKVIWDENTRDYLKRKFKAAQDEAEGMISDQLQEKDFLQWLRKCSEVINGVDSYSVLGRIVQIVDREAIKPAYTADPRIKFDYPNEVFWGLTVRRISKAYDTKKHKEVIKRESINYWREFLPEHTYMQAGNTSPVKDYFLSVSRSAPFITVKTMTDEQLAITYGRAGGNAKGLTTEQLDKLKAKRALILKYINESTFIKNYDDIVVPESWKEQYDKSQVEGDDLPENAPPALTPAELRKLNAQTVVYAPTHRRIRYSRTGELSWDKHEPKVVDLEAFEGNLYYGTTDEVETIGLAASVTSLQLDEVFASKGKLNDKDPIQLFRVAKGNVKYFKGKRHIDEFFERVEETTLTCDPLLIKWQTARLIANEMEGLKFFENFKQFNPELTDIYFELKDFAAKKGGRFINTRGVVPDSKLREMRDKWNKMIELQLSIRENPKDADLIARKAADAGITCEGWKDVKMIDIELYDKLQRLKDFAENVSPLLNIIPTLTTNKAKISFEASRLINEFLELKNS